MKFDKILILQQNLLGDVVISTGVVKAIREQFPQSRIAFLVSPDTAALMQLPFVDEIIPYEKGMPMLPVIRRVWRYDIAICLDFKYRSAVIPFFARIPVRAGLAHKRKLFMTHAVPRPADSEQTYFTRYMAKVIKNAIGLELTHDLTHLYVADATEQDKADVDRVLAGLPEDTLKIAIAPFSSTGAKDWPAERYGELMQRLRDEQPCTFVIIGGSVDRDKEFPLAEDVIDCRGRLSLTASAEALRRVDYFMGSCSAPLHIATAVGKPILAFYGPTSPLKWAPLNQCKVLFHKQQCNPCDRIGYGTPCRQDNVCMKSITVDEAWTAFSELRREQGEG